MCVGIASIPSIAAASAPLTAAAAVSYSVNAVQPADAGKRAQFPGVYYAKATKDHAGQSNLTIGIPVLAKQDLNQPTTLSPAIIMGAAVPQLVAIARMTLAVLVVLRFQMMIYRSRRDDNDNL